MKALKQLNGILHFMDDDEFEEFRICQSMCTNTTALGIETNGIGHAPYQMIRDAGVPVMELRAKTDKVTKSLAMGARYEAGKVFHLMDASWLEDYEQELLMFPNGKHDDQVDTASYAAIMLAVQYLIHPEKAGALGQ